MALQNNTGAYNASLASGFAPRFTVLGNLTSLNGRFTTGRFDHMVAFGMLPRFRSPLPELMRMFTLFCVLGATYLLLRAVHRRRFGDA